MRAELKNPPIRIGKKNGLRIRETGRGLLGFGTLSAALMCAACEQNVPAPPSRFFGGLPISGGLADAHRAGFKECFNMDAVHVRCRRHGVMLEGEGPYEAAVDLKGSKGQSGFHQLTLWHYADQSAVYKVGETLKKKGWQSCFSANGNWGDQAIYTRHGVPLHASIDISYWGKRRLRLIPDSSAREDEKPCGPKHSGRKEDSIAPKPRPRQKA